MGGTNDDSTAAAAVWVFPCLQHLGLGHNAIGPQGAEAIARAITPDASGRYNTSLASLDLEDTGIKGFVGFGVRAARGGGGGADDDAPLQRGFAQLCIALLPTRRWEEDTEDDEGGGEREGGGGGDGKDRDERETKTEAGRVVWACNRSLRRLKLGGNGLAADPVHHLSRVLGACGGYGNRLTHLDLANNPLGDDGATALAGGLEDAFDRHGRTAAFLGHAGCSEASSEPTDYRHDLSTLRSLRLEGCRIGEHGGTSLARALKVRNFVRSNCLACTRCVVCVA